MTPKFKVIDIDQAAWFEYKIYIKDKDGEAIPMEPFKILIESLDAKDIKHIEKKASYITFNEKHQKETKIDLRKQDQLGVKQVVKDFKNLKWKHLNHLVVPKKGFVPDDGTKVNPETPVDFSEALLDAIAENMTGEFATFVVGNAMDYAAHREQQKKEEKKEEKENLSNGSGGKEAKRG